MEKHLNDSEMAELLLGTAPPRARAHAAVCADCRGDREVLAAAAACLRQEVAEGANLPDYFWARQRARIAARATHPAGSLRWALAGGLALTALAFALLTGQTAPVPVPPDPVTASQRALDHDEQLLLDIQHSLRHEVPDPLMPAAVLVQEIAPQAPQANELKEN